MKLYFATEARFVKRNNKYYSLGGFSKELWVRYLEHFDELEVIARVSSDDSIEVDDSMLASYDNVHFIELPYYIGLNGFIANRRVINAILRNKLKNDGCYICRLPGQIGGSVISELKKKGIPYSCEVVGNPWDVFSKGSVNHPLRPIIRQYSTLSLKRQVKNAQACLYVTQRTLQRMYPVKAGAFSVGVSDVIVKENTLATTAKVLTRKETYSLISVGSLAQMYKAPDIVLKALSVLKDKGFSIKLTWLGDGVFRQDMIDLAQSLKLNVDFKGNVSAQEVHQYLADADIFLLVSRTEGLPRAVVEAMAHGLPCIGSKVGGIPELLENSALVEKENVPQLAQLIEQMINNLDFTNEQAVRNLKEAQLYKEDILRQKRIVFFDYIKKQYHEW